MANSEDDARQPAVSSAMPKNEPKNSKGNENASQDPSERHKQDLPCHTGTVASSAGLKAIAVIGTTGFLGPYIAAVLLRSGAGSEIFCINRSADGELRTTAALASIGVDCPSILPHPHFLIADITEPTLYSEPLDLRPRSKLGVGLEINRCE